MRACASLSEVTVYLAVCTASVSAAVVDSTLRPSTSTVGVPFTFAWLAMSVTLFVQAA